MVQGKESQAEKFHQLVSDKLEETRIKIFKFWTEYQMFPHTPSNILQPTTPLDRIFSTKLYDLNFQ